MVCPVCRLVVVFCLSSLDLCVFLSLLLDGQLGLLLVAAVLTATTILTTLSLCVLWHDVEMDDTR